MVILTRPLSLDTVSLICKELKEGILPPAYQLYDLLDTAEIFLLQSKSLLNLQSPIKIVGDLHGQFYDILPQIESGGKFLFLGDYVDRGLNSVELFLYLLCMKILYPDNFHLLRGNHESRELTETYGFRTEVNQKYSISAYLRFCDLFERLSIAALIDGNVFCVHGGLSPLLLNLSTLDDIESIPILDLLWGDPTDSVKNFKASPRGAGYLFGIEAIENFLIKFKCTMVVRSHQLVESGFKIDLKGRCLTVWSAPNYCYERGNGASILEISGSGYRVNYFKEATPQYKVSRIKDGERFL